MHISMYYSHGGTAGLNALRLARAACGLLPYIAGIPRGKSDASGGIGPKHIVTSTSGFSARFRPMRPIFPVEFQL